MVHSQCLPFVGEGSPGVSIYCLDSCDVCGRGRAGRIQKGAAGWERFLSFSFCFRATLRVQRFNAVFRLLVPYQPTSIDEGGVAQMALQHPNVPVGVSMRLQTVRPGEAFPANFALVRPFAGVRAQMNLERLWPCKFLLAQVTPVLGPRAGRLFQVGTDSADAATHAGRAVLVFVAVVVFMLVLLLVATLLVLLVLVVVTET